MASAAGSSKFRESAVNGGQGFGTGMKIDLSKTGERPFCKASALGKQHCLPFGSSESGNAMD